MYYSFPTSVTIIIEIMHIRDIKSKIYFPDILMFGEKYATI